MPVTCPTCNTHLPNWTDLCPRCGHVFPAATPPYGPPEASPTAETNDPAPDQKPSEPAPTGGGLDRYPAGPPFRATKAFPVILAIVVAVVALGFLAVHLRGAASQAATAGGQSGNANPNSGNANSNSGNANPNSGSDESTQLANVETILGESETSRNELHRALQTACTDPADAVSSIQDVLSRRRAEIAEAEGLDMSAVPNGARLASDLVALLRASASADSAYATSIQDIDNDGCDAGAAGFRRGNSLSVTAQQDKSAFFKLWTPLAEQYGLTPYDAASI